MLETQYSIRILIMHVVFLLFLILSVALLAIDCFLFFYFDIPQIIKILKKGSTLLQLSDLPRKDESAVRKVNKLVRTIAARKGGYKRV